MYKKSHILAGALAVAAMLTVGCYQNATSPTDTDGSFVVEKPTGNGAPSGTHFNLNIIGVPKEKTADMDGNNGHRIFVSLEGNTKIGLAEGEDFAVLDANGTDKDGARFQLPNPDPTNSGTTVYSVFARALGTPGGSADMTTCAMWENPETGELEEVCSSAVLEVERTKGRQRFENVSRRLLYIYADLDGDGKDERYNLFNDALEDYFWSYDNNGLKLLQLRFYPMSTEILD
jgi:hypothetical protein